MIAAMLWCVEFCPRGPCGWCDRYAAALYWLVAKENP